MRAAPRRYDERGDRARDSLHLKLDSQEHAMSDTALHRSVMEALAGNPHIHADEIAVQALDDYGDIILRGTVGSIVQQAEAMRTASGVSGVRHVEDALEVRVMGIDGRADADTEAAVLDAMAADDRVHARDIEVDVKDGAVTLRGLVEVAEQRDRAERIALAVPGVASVENRLRVWLTVSADDVAERVTDAIGRDAIVGRDSVTVRVTGNDVVLSGSVRSAGHRDAAVAAAESAPGVARVHDEITVGDAPVC
jgi:osmotically-inducible protein OsmY